MPLWHAVFKVISTPLTKPTFFHTYVADVFTSMVKVFQDILWTGCFFISGDFLIIEGTRLGEAVEPKNWQSKVWYKNIVIPLVCLFPLWTRFNQCLRRYYDTGKRTPNLLNAAKYALSQTVTLFGAFHPLYLMYIRNKEEDEYDDDTLVVEESNSKLSLFEMFWMGIFIASSLYSYFWDVRMDWGLGRINNRLLGTRLMFPKAQVYYVVMVVDLFLRYGTKIFIALICKTLLITFTISSTFYNRFMWVTTLIPPQSGAQFEIPQYLSLVTMAMELFR